MTDPTFLGLPDAGTAADIVVVCAPYDLTSTWGKGADRGPAALLAASGAVETWDEETGTDLEALRYAVWRPTDASAFGVQPPEDMVAELAEVHGRWLDQGARQALPILAATTRRNAGIAEVALAEHLPDRTDWRALVSREATPVDLLKLRDELTAKLTVVPEGVTWLDEQAQNFNYPVIQYGHRLKRLRLDEDPVISGNLIGIKGQFLLFEHGVFNVRQHTSYHVCATASGERAASSVGGSDQMELFS